MGSAKSQRRWEDLVSTSPCLSWYWRGQFQHWVCSFHRGAHVWIFRHPAGGRFSRTVPGKLYWFSIRVRLGFDPDTVMEIEGATGTFEELRDGVVADDGKTQVTWIGNKRNGRIEVQELVWTVNWDFTTENYQEVLTGKEFTFTQPDGTTTTIPGENMTDSFLNSLAVAIPATVIPILIAAFAAYAFAWMSFPGRKLLFISSLRCFVVPLQLALVPILQDFRALGINGEFMSVWLAHTGFGLALAVYLLFNYVVTLPREMLESAFIDGASHFTVFRRLVLPLSVPALASFAIFQFLWVWNDYLVALIFLGGTQDKEVITMRLAGDCRFAW